MNEKLQLRENGKGKNYGYKVQGTDRFLVCGEDGNLLGEII